MILTGGVRERNASCVLGRGRDVGAAGIIIWAITPCRRRGRGFCLLGRKGSDHHSVRRVPCNGGSTQKEHGIIVHFAN